VKSQARRDVLAKRLLFLILAIAVPLARASFTGIFNDGDVSWHIASGQWILQHGKIPITDHFSFTATGHPWVAMEWLADTIYAFAFDAFGYAGLAAVVAAALMALHIVLFAHLQSRASLLVVVVTLIAMNVALTPFIVARPHVLVWPLLAGWTALLARGTETGHPPPLWAAVFPFVWANLHGSFPLAALIGAALAFDALAKSEWKTLWEWLLFAAVSLVAVTLNANGVAGLLQPFRFATLDLLPLVQEWQPSTPSLTPQFYVIVLAGFGALLWVGVRVPLGRLALLLLMLAMAFSQMRSQSWFVIVASVLVPAMFKTRADPLQRWMPLVLPAIPVLLLRALWPITPAENSANPRHLLAAIPDQLKTQPVLNGYTFGGPLILAGIKPYVDGRAEVYGDAFIIDYAKILDGDEGRFNRAAKQYGIRWTMLPAGSTQLIGQLDSSKDWRRIYSDRVGVIHVRTSGN
jgi:hypothetical protein